VVLSVLPTLESRHSSRQSQNLPSVTQQYVAAINRTLPSSDVSQNFPYATIDPEEARVIVPDDRFDDLCKMYNPKSRVPANLTVYDIAGLTRGASTGAGLGNAFLSHIRAVDAIFQVVRCFDDAEIIHVEGDVDPVRDLNIISEELRIKDIEFTEKALDSVTKLTKRGGQSLEMKKLKEDQATVEKVLELLKSGKDVRRENWGPKEVREHRSLPFSHFSFMMNQSYKLYNPSSLKLPHNRSEVYEKPSQLITIFITVLC